MTERVFVTGVGIISAIGLNLKETIASLQGSKSGIGRMNLLDSIYKDEIPVAEVKATNKELTDLLEVTTDKGIFSRTALLGIVAAKQALADSHINDIKKYRTGLISATTVGGMDRSEKFYKKFQKDNSRGRLKDIITHDCGESTERIADSIGIRDYVSTISTACSSSANSILTGTRLIENGIMDRVIA
ncbi:MAG: beta-ketoacyl synthase N-terminal-like domain-containing protein, partial [Bacteroidia bacterium]|nr:beta-ketoacyl synthase N-terminal-like domain-containing protein [Bacteroidia bacterium]